MNVQWIEDPPEGSSCSGLRCGSDVTHQDGAEFLCAAHALQRVADGAPPVSPAPPMAARNPPIERPDQEPEG